MSKGAVMSVKMRKTIRVVPFKDFIVGGLVWADGSENSRYDTYIQSVVL
jgi:hypothetical protein